MRNCGLSNFLFFIAVIITYFFKTIFDFLIFQIIKNSHSILHIKNASLITFYIASLISCIIWLAIPHQKAAIFFFIMSILFLNFWLEIILQALLYYKNKFKPNNFLLIILLTLATFFIVTLSVMITGLLGFIVWQLYHYMST